MPHLLSRIVKYWSPPCFVALGLLVMAFVFFGGSALSQPFAAPRSAPVLGPAIPPPEAVTQAREEPGFYDAQGSSVAIDPSGKPPTDVVHVGATSGSALWN